jgi:hypothetical protein
VAAAPAVATAPAVAAAPTVAVAAPADSSGSGSEPASLDSRVARARQDFILFCFYFNVNFAYFVGIVADPGCLSRIRMFPIPDLRAQGLKGTGSRIRILTKEL